MSVILQRFPERGHGQVHLSYKYDDEIVIRLLATPLMRGWEGQEVDGPVCSVMEGCYNDDTVIVSLALWSNSCFLIIEFRSPAPTIT